MQSACYEAQHVLAAAYLAQDPLVGGTCRLCMFHVTTCKNARMDAYLVMPVKQPA